MNDQERYQMMKAMLELLEQKGVNPSGRDFLTFYAQTTDSTISLRNIEELQSFGYVTAKIMFEGQIPVDVQGIKVTTQGEKFIQSVEAASSKKKKSWLTENKRWAIGVSIPIVLWLILFCFNTYNQNLINRTMLKALYREFDSNIEVINAIATDKQYLDGKQGGYYGLLSFSAYHAVESKGVIHDELLSSNLQKIYDKLFKTTDSSLAQTKTSTREKQISMYEMIKYNYQKYQSFVMKTRADLKQYLLKLGATSQELNNKEELKGQLSEAVSTDVLFAKGR